jgi:hypothetical protein
MMEGDTLFVAAIDNNNGIRQRIDEPPQFEGNCITVNYNGSVGEAFYQPQPFCASDDVNVLYPKGWTLTCPIGLFLVTIIRLNKYRFGYGRKWTLEKMRETALALPSAASGLPDWDFMEQYICAMMDETKITTQIPHRELPLDTTTWQRFKLSALFRQERGKRLTRENRIEGNVPLATAGFAHEGIAEHVANDEMKIYRDVLTIDMFCNCFYRGYEFVCDDNILVLDPLFGKANRYNLLFLATVISADKYRYAYGRQYRQKDFREHVVQLPADKKGEPDWKFMENYVKSLPYSDRI